jgi:exonuclease SbcC
LEQAAATARTELTTARTDEDAAQAGLTNAASAVSNSRSELAASRDPLARYGAPPLTNPSLAGAWDELLEWACTRVESLSQDIRTTRINAIAADTAYNTAATELTDALTRNGLTPPEPATPAATLRSTIAATGASAAATAHAAAIHATERRAERTKLEAKRVAAVEQEQVSRELGRLLRSDGFRAWLLESALFSLVSDASDILFEMSSGQFELRAGKDLDVIDHNDADSTRSVRTLSGGETFQASLALALALSRQVATLATSGAAKLESIFLDEGFGTLDEASLDVVAGALETLATSGERMVGVITHVNALAERIPVQFQVSRTGSSSTIVRVSA